MTPNQHFNWFYICTNPLTTAHFVQSCELKAPHQVKVAFKLAT